MLHVGDHAPEFEDLKQYQGKWVLLYFYPKDHTPGCITEACNFRDNFEELNKKVVILGVSGDSQESHEGFAKKYNLPFPLIADQEKKIIQAYGADGMLFAKRSSFLINPEGIIAKIYSKVDPNTHTQDVLENLKTFVS